MPPRKRHRPTNATQRQNEEEIELHPFGRLIQYNITGLFGTNNVHHTFSLDYEEPTILTGVNGTGKSTILRTIAYTSQNNWEGLTGIPFEEMSLHFEAADLKIENEGNNLKIYLNTPHTGPIGWDTSDSQAPMVKHVRNILAHRQVTPSWMEELFDLSQGEEWRTAVLGTTEPDKPNWVRAIGDAFPALLVSDQRLSIDSRHPRPRKRGVGEVVDTFSAIEGAFLHINEEVQKYRSLYATTSQALDREFPRRVLSAMHPRGKSSLPEGHIDKEFSQLQNLRRSLANTGLVGAAEAEDSLSDFRLDTPEIFPFISTYLEDTRKKLATFEPLRQRLEPFIAFLRRHYRNKDIGIDEEGHFQVTSKLTGEPIPPTNLSSGEQQILILAHKVLFETAAGTLVMIDEPELSLHVLWQSTFIEDLTEMSSVTGSYFLLATHSPTLIAGRNDLRRSLDG